MEVINSIDISDKNNLLNLFGDEFNEIIKNNLKKEETICIVKIKINDENIIYYIFQYYIFIVKIENDEKSLILISDFSNNKTFDEYKNYFDNSETKEKINQIISNNKINLLKIYQIFILIMEFN